MAKRPPPPEDSGWIKTLNQTGFMTSVLDPVSAKWVDFGAQAEGWVLEIGCAYGIATLEALRRGAQVKATDLHAGHLEILRESARSEGLDLNRLRTSSGKFPMEFEGGDRFEAILACRVLHFLDDIELKEAISKIFELLKPGGKAFVVGETPYLSNFKNFIPIFEERKKKGDPFPGLIKNPAQFDPSRGASLPPILHFFDEDLLERLFADAGFEIEFLSTLNRKDFPNDLRLDGRESVGIIGKK